MDSKLKIKLQNWCLHSKMPPLKKNHFHIQQHKSNQKRDKQWRMVFSGKIFRYTDGQRKVSRREKEDTPHQCLSASITDWKKYDLLSSMLSP